MTTATKTETKTETKTGRAQAPDSETLTEDTKRAYEIHTLVTMLYGKITNPSPWNQMWWSSQPPPMGQPWDTAQPQHPWGKGWPDASASPGVWGW